MPNTTYGTAYAQSSDLVSNWPGVSSSVADRIDDVSFKGNGLNDQTGTIYTLVLTDAGKTVTLNNASAVTVTVPTNASVAYETGTVIAQTNKGAGVVTISPAGGVTLNNSVTLAQNASASIQKLDTNTWVMIAAQTPGLTLITSSTFSAVSSVSVNNCFTSTYDNYRIVFTVSAGTSSITPQFRLRASGSDNSSANYYFQGTYYSTTSLTAPTSNRSAGLTSQFSIGDVTSNHCYAVIDVIGPQSSTYLTGVLWNWIANGLTDSSTSCGAGRMSVTTSYDGFTYFNLAGGGGTMTGTVRVYGYRNS